MADIVSKVQEFFYEDEAFARLFEDFANENCHIFDNSTEELKFEYTELYKEYQDLFEQQLTS